MRILYLTQRVPYPPDRGDKISSWHHVERLARKHSVTIVAFAHDDDDRRAADELRAKGFTVHTQDLGSRAVRLARTLPLLATWKPLTLGYYGSGALRSVVDRLVPEHDLAMAFSSSMGAYLLEHESIPRIVFLAELDSDKWRQYAEHESFPLSWVHRREYRTLRRFESVLSHAVELNLLVTPLEEEIFNRLIPGAPSKVVRNGVERAPEGFERAPDADQLVFVGMMDYFPNVQGCAWFVEEVLPLVRRARPSARLAIVGARPNAKVRALAKHDGVEVTGRVDDPRDRLRRAAVSVAPLHIARGIQNKVLEAMSLGVPVVGTTSATQGVGAKADEHYLVRDDARGTADAIVELLADPARAEALGAAGRSFVERKYDWETVLQPLDAIVEVFEHSGLDPEARRRRRSQ
ncbi:MAG: TIGR03087 family PEP-CTERM/XrtA system glycosyltransferase [Planctomycetota bacterium]